MRDELAELREGLRCRAHRLEHRVAALRAVCDCGQPAPRRDQLHLRRIEVQERAVPTALSEPVRDLCRLAHEDGLAAPRLLQRHQINVLVSTERITKAWMNVARRLAKSRTLRLRRR